MFFKDNKYIQFYKPTKSYIQIQKRIWFKNKIYIFGLSKSVYFIPKTNVEICNK